MAVSIALKKNVIVQEDDGVHDITHDEDLPCDLAFLVSDRHTIVYMAEVDDFDEKNCRSHNIFCFGSEEDGVIVCPTCHLTYHSTCVRWKDECGCTSIPDIKARYDLKHQTYADFQVISASKNEVF